MHVRMDIAMGVDERESTGSACAPGEPSGRSFCDEHCRWRPHHQIGGAKHAAGTANITKPEGHDCPRPARNRQPPPRDTCRMAAMTAAAD
jgi:hypothetical protein